MAAAETDEERGKPAAQIRLNEALFDRLTRALGAETDIARAKLFGLHRTTMYRIRLGKITPALDVATRMADVLGTTVDRLFQQEQVK